MCLRGPGRVPGFSAGVRPFLPSRLPRDFNQLRMVSMIGEYQERNRAAWPNGKALVFGSPKIKYTKDCAFESHRGRLYFLSAHLHTPASRDHTLGTVAIYLYGHLDDLRRPGPGQKYAIARTHRAKEPTSRSRSGVVSKPPAQDGSPPHWPIPPLDHATPRCLVLVMPV